HALALADHMQRATAAGTGDAVDAEPHILARQMAGQRFVTGRPFGWLLLSRPTALLLAGEIAFDLFKPGCELIGVEALGTAAELRALQLLDDRFEALDLAVAMFDLADNIAHQAMQKFCFYREIVEVELHVRFYSNMLIRRSNFAFFGAGFC